MTYHYLFRKNIYYPTYQTEDRRCFLVRATAPVYVFVLLRKIIHFDIVNNVVTRVRVQYSFLKLDRLLMIRFE